MVREFIKYTWYFVFFVLLQTLILNNIQFSSFINPYLYVFFILILPFELPKFFLLVASFLLGLSIDLFSNTPGMHTTACLTMAFARPYLLEFIAPREGYETGQKPLASYFGWNWYFRYSLIMVVIHHVVLFFIEVFSFQNFHLTLFRTFLSIGFTLVLIFLTQMFFFNPRRSA